MSSNKSSLFDLLEKEREHAASTMHIEPRQPKKAKKIKGTMGFRRAKKARRSRKA